MNIIADVTKSYPGTTPQLLNRIARHAPSQSAVEVLAYEDQLVELQMHPTLEAYVVKGVSRTTSIGEVALEMVLASITSFPVTLVFSFQPQVLALATRLDIESRQKVVFLPWSQAVQHLASSQVEVALKAADSSVFAIPPTDQEGIDLLVRALQEKGAKSQETAVKQSNIRPILANLDPRFQGGSSAIRQGFISSVVNRAVKAGRIQTRATPSNADIWLTTEVSAQVQIPLPIPAAQVVPPPSGVTRSDSYTEILKKHNMGPFPNLRDDLYVELENAVNQKLTVTKVITNTLSKVQATHREKGKIPWTAVHNFLVALLTRRPVLLDAQDNPIAPSFQTGRIEIIKLAPNFKDKLDGELVLFLLEKKAEIMYVDLPSLVGTLYMNRDPENHDRLHRVIHELFDCKAIQDVDNTIILAAREAGTVTYLPQAKGQNV